MAETAHRPKVTICLPTIGRLTYIEQTLESLARQTLSDYELLVLYNGTDGNTAAKLASLVATHPGGRVLPDADTMPMFANFNRGLREARGEYVAFFHDDDIYEPNFLERLVHMLDVHPSAAFAGSNYLIIDSENKVEGLRRLIKRTEIQDGRTFIRDLIRAGRAVLPTPGIVFRTSTLVPGGWDEKLSMHFGDYVVLMRLAEQHEAALIAEPLMRLRLHGRNASNVPMSSASPLQFQIISSYIAEFAGRWPSDPLNSSLKLFARNTLIRHLYWGWLSAEDDAEANRCIELLKAEGEKVLPNVLLVAGRLGLSANRRSSLTDLMRRLGRIVR